MKEIVKQRIEQIKNGDAPEGYTKTKAGILPKWKCLRIDQIAQPITDKVGNGNYETLSISAGVGFVNQAKKFGKELSGKQYEKYTILKRDDFSYNKGNSKTYPQGCIYRLKDRDVAAVPNVFESFSIKKNNLDYYEQLFSSGFLNKQLSTKINHGVRDDGLLNLTEKDFYSCHVPVPPLAEQQKIAEILMQCDKVIELYEKMVDEIKKFKKACLQKMFPRKGETVPEIRFPDFTDDWEQRKLGDLAVEVKRKADKDSDAPVMMISASEGFIDQSQRYSNNNAGSSLKNYTLLYEGELAYNHGYSKFRNFGSVFDLKVEKARIPFVYHSFALPEDDHRFFAYYLNSGLFDGELKKLVSSTARMDGLLNISYEDYMSIPVLRPPVQEQKKIGRFLTSLDTLITLHQRKLEEQKKYKKSLMQLLLTGIVRVKI